MANPLQELLERLEKYLTKASVPFTRHDGRLRVTRGSTAVFIKPTTWAAGHALVELVVPVLNDVERSEKLLERLNELNGTLYFGKAYWHDGGVWIAHNLLGSHVDPDELITAVGMLVTVADKLDDELKAVFGGTRWIES